MFQRLILGMVVMIIPALGMSRSAAQEAAPPVSSERTLPEESLYKRMLAGDVAGAREGYRALLDQKLTQLSNLKDKSPKDARELANQAAVLENAVRTIRFWQSAEVEQRLKGSTTPENVLSQILTALDTVKSHAKGIDQSANQLLVGREARTRGSGRDVQAAIKRTGKLFLMSVDFLRDTSMAGRRADLFLEAKRYVPAPNTLKEFDAHQGGDLRKSFGTYDFPEEGTRGNP
jgi:hypothetical protein